MIIQLIPQNPAPRDAEAFLSRCRETVRCAGAVMKDSKKRAAPNLSLYRAARARLRMAQSYLTAFDNQPGDAA